MLYLMVKTFHVVAVIFWIGALGLVTLITSCMRMDANQMRLATKVTEASIGVTWLAGITLVLMGSWYGATWWQIKVVLVVIISAIHTIVHRRWKASVAEGIQTPNFVPVLIFVLILPVVALAIVKQPM